MDEKKVVSLDQFLDIRERLRAEGKIVASTNGCFDILHLGHVRCLQEAKKLGDVLVVGLNSDASVTCLKGPGRPLRPQEERAEILAALSCVDYVVIFNESTPEGLLAEIKPDIHCKGGDYKQRGGKPIPEAKVVTRYGGRVEILPHFCGYSTTNVLATILERKGSMSPARSSVEALVLHSTKQKLSQIISQFSGKKVIVLGDVMLDEYIWGEVSRISPEAPVPVVEVQRMSYMPGGATNVAMNIASLGGKVYLAGVVGADEAGERLRALFLSNGVNIDGLRVDQGQPTTLKTRIMARNQQVMRVDREVRKPITKAIMQELLAYILETIVGVDALLVSDYAKGVTVPTLLRGAIAAAKEHGKPVVVDPKGRDFSGYKGATVITPNQLEAALAVNEEIIDEASLVEVGQRLLHQVGCEAVLITRGEEGMSLFEGNGRVIHLPAVAREVYDVTGAGDTAVGVFTLALAAKTKLADCARIANCAAGIVVGKLGTAVVTPEELKVALDGYTRRYDS